jgi:glycogen debranching enzyme
MSAELTTTKRAHTLPRIRPSYPSEITFPFSDTSSINILNGNRFMVSSKSGDLSEIGHGLYRDDTRFLSLFRMKINENLPLVLTSRNTSHYSAAFYLTNPDIHIPHKRHGASRRNGGCEIEKESLVIERFRFIRRGLREELLLTNVTKKRLPIALSFEVDSDFADLFEVKSRTFGKRQDLKVGASLEPGGSRKRISKRFIISQNVFDFSYKDTSYDFRAETLVWFSKRGKVNRSREISFDFSLGPKEKWHLTVAMILLVKGEPKRTKSYTDEYFEEQEEKIERTIRRWNLQVPKLNSSWDILNHSYYQSLIDISSLSFPDPTGKHRWELPAAGCPWFMTLFGRDTLITSYQTLLFGSNLARGAIEALSYYQAGQVDENKDAEPGKIIHETRYGDYAVRSKRYPYYGTVDATELFLILISEIYRWTGDQHFVNKHRPNIMRALDWIEKYGDVDGDGFVEYERRSKEGLDNQCWKDSWNSIQFSDGKIATKTPIATSEVQGYVYDAKIRIAEIAKQVWKDRLLSKKLLDEANELKELFNEKFWIEDKGHYAVALDGEKKQVDSMTSNNGQLFWSGIVSEDKVSPVVEKLMDDSMFSGYGIRTLSSKDKGFDPIGYHTGCVWPHDNSLIAIGLANYGRRKEALRIIESVLSAAPHFLFTFPEVFAGFPKRETWFPVRYPTSCSPQAWAAGSPILFLRTLLGLSPSRNRKSIDVNPISFGDKITSVELKGIEAFGRKFSIEIKDGSRNPKVYELSESARK